MPGHHNGGSQLEAALSFYSTIVTINQEGDSLVSDETLEGLGTAGFILQALFGSLLRIANPDLALSTTTRPSPSSPNALPSAEPPEQFPFTEQISTVPPEMATPASAVRYGGPAVAVAFPDAAAIKRPMLPHYEVAPPQQPAVQDISDLLEEDTTGVVVTPRLTDLLPEPGYFLAGAVSGGVSRTATAPLDRLKVYLLVNTKASPAVAAAAVDAAAAANLGRPLAGLRSAGGPIVDAIASLWRAGGLKTFFAGKRCRSCWQTCMQ